MDPSTTLITFMLQTHPSVKSVHLIGSWDSFTKYHVMERDARRDWGQWKGCHSFKDISCDGEFGSPHNKRDGGLKMGHTYYYYYELDGSYETHDPALPSTTTCPYLPGQTVNTIHVPEQRTLRKRSASLSSIKSRDFRTMNPDDKFLVPKALPAVVGNQNLLRVGSSALTLRSRASSRSLSPAPAWKRLLGFRSGREERGRHLDIDGQSISSSMCDDTRSIASSNGTRSRDISPESLRRFLSDDPPFAASAPEEPPSVTIPEDITEEVEDDDNFATSATSETLPYATCLSPPPFKRATSSGASSLQLAANNDSSMTLTRFVKDGPAIERGVGSASPMPSPMDDLPPSRFSVSTVASMEYLASPHGLDDEAPSFYDSNDDDDLPSSRSDAFSFQPLSLPSTRKQSLDHGASSPFAAYSLPQPLAETKHLALPSPLATVGSSALVARGDNGMPGGNTSLLTAPVESGFDDLANEIGWMVDIISGKGI